MGIINEIQDKADEAADAAGDAVDEAVDTVEEAAQNPKETAGDAADAAGDAVNEAVDAVEEAAGGNQDKNKESDGGNQGQNTESKQSGGSAGFTASPEQVTDTFTGPSESEQADRLDDAIDQEDAEDADIANDNIDPNAENPRFLETGAEQTLSKANRQDSTKTSDKAAEIKAQGFTAAQNRADRAEEAAETIQRQKQKVESSRAAEFEFTKGGETETVSKQEAVNKLEQQRQQLEQNREQIQSNQLERLDNLRQLNEQSTTFTPEKAAEKFDVSKRGVSITFLGRDTGVDLEGNAAEAFTFADTVTSGGAQSADALASIATGADTEQITERQVFEETQERRAQGFDPLGEAADTATSVPGIAATTVAGGAAFQAGTRAAQAAGATKTVTAARAGGIALGGAAAAKQTQKFASEAGSGQGTKAAGTAIETAAGFGGFSKGSRQFAKAFKPKIGTQRSATESVTDAAGQGVGRTKVTSTVVKPSLKSKLGSEEPETFQVNSRARFQLDGRQAKGAVQSELPDGTATDVKRFESLQNPKNTVKTDGVKIEDSTTTTRLKEESRLFTRRTDTQTDTTARIQEPEQADTETVLNKFDSVQALDQSTAVTKQTATTTNPGSTRFGETTAFRIGRGSQDGGAGGAGGSSGSGGQTAGGTSTSFSRAQPDTNLDNPGSKAAESQALDSFTTPRARTGGSPGTDTQGTQANTQGPTGERQAGNTADLQDGLTVPSIEAQRQTRGTQNGDSTQGTGAELLGGGPNQRQNTDNTLIAETPQTLNQDTGTQTRSATLLDTQTTTRTTQTQKTQTKPRQRPGTPQITTPITGTKTMTRQRTTPITTQRITQNIEDTGRTPTNTDLTTNRPGQTTITPTATPKIGGGLGLPRLADGGADVKPLQGIKGFTSGGRRETVNIGFFEANAFEQRTGRQARFDLSQDNIRRQARKERRLGALSFGLEPAQDVENRRAFNGGELI